MADPPLEAGVDQAIATLPFPAVAAVMVGAPGTLIAVADSSPDRGLSPKLLIALTW